MSNSERNLEVASSTLTQSLREAYCCWFAVGVANDRLIVYYDEDARPSPAIPTEWNGVKVEAIPTSVPTIG